MTGNPTLNENTFTRLQEVRSSGAVMTVQGTVNKTAILLFLALVAGSYTWGLVFKGNAAAAMPWATGGAIVGFIFAMVTCFKQQW
ncbi:MAG: Bax inhibitor-1/YccA family protein, partial [Verrucomicrobiota bacterium]